MAQTKIDLMDLFQRIKWASSGTTHDMSKTNYNWGWAYLGDDKPTVQDFNFVQQKNDEKDIWLFNQINEVLKLEGITASEDEVTSLRDAIKGMFDRQWCESIAQLRTIEPTEHNQRILVRGYYAGSNVGGGEFYADLQDSTTADNAGTVIVTAGGKRWIRVISDDSVFIEWFGVTDEDGSTAINRALAFAKERNSTKVVAQGNAYNIKNRLNFFANTHVDFNHATLNKDFIKDELTNASSLSYFDSSSGNSNLTIENAIVKMNGHLLKGDTSAGHGGANFFGASNIKNLVIRNVEVHDIKNVHAIDLGNYHNVLIENCRFLGAFYEDGDDVKDRWYSEAIQLENQTQGTNYQETGTIAVVRNCYFGASDNSPAWMSGIGNHGGYDKALAPHKVLVEGCTFEGMSYAGVRTFGAWEEVKVINNTFDGLAGAGFVATNRDAWSDWKGSVSNLVISNNSFKNHTGYAAISFLRNLKGDADAGDNVLADKINISNNIIESTHEAIRLFSVRNAVIANNVSKTGEGFANCTDLKDSLFTGNNIEITNSGKTAIYIRDMDNSDTGYKTGSSNVSIKDNLIKGARRAIHAQTVKGISIENNLISNRTYNNTEDKKIVALIACDTSCTQVLILNNVYKSNDDELFDSSFVGVVVSYIDDKTVVHGNNLAGMSVKVAGNSNRGFVTLSASGSPVGVVVCPQQSIYYDSASGKKYIKTSGSGTSANGWVDISSIITNDGLYLTANAPSLILENSVRKVGLNLSAGNNVGLWDFTNTKWLAYADPAGILKAGTAPVVTASGSEFVTAGWFKSQFTQSLTDNGWERLPNGRIMQWATFSVNTGGDFSFPIAFPNKCFAVLATDTNDSGTNTVYLSTTNITNTGFSIQARGGDVGLFSILAIGY